MPEIIEEAVIMKEHVILGESEEVNQQAMLWGLRQTETQEKNEEARKLVWEWVRPLFEKRQTQSS